MKKFNENNVKPSLVLLALGFLLAFGCKSEGNGDGNDTPTVIKHTLSITKPTGSTLSSNAGGISCGSKGTTCKAEFSKDSKVTLNAKADTSYTPAAWQGDCDKTDAGEACKLNMDADKTTGKSLYLCGYELMDLICSTTLLPGQRP